jgi:hypothetical protein
MFFILLVYPNLVTRNRPVARHDPAHAGPHCPARDAESLGPEKPKAPISGS